MGHIPDDDTIIKSNGLIKNLKLPNKENVNSLHRNIYNQILSGKIAMWVVNSDGLLHNDNDEPAVIAKNGTKKWFKNGLLHRDNDLPAIIDFDGTKKWFLDGELARLNDLHTEEYTDGTKVWGISYHDTNGVYHQSIHRGNDLPAVIHSNGTKVWYKHRKLHRDGGMPAVIRPPQLEYNGEVTLITRLEYWENGILICKLPIEPPPKKSILQRLFDLIVNKN